MSYNIIIQKELECLIFIQDFFYHYEGLDALIRSIVSKNPLQDIVLILLPFFFIGIFDIGIEHFW
jgi:hypothetical protein